MPKHKLTQKGIGTLCFKAADILERDGWCKGGLGTNDGPKCALGAMRYARYQDVNTSLDADKLFFGLWRATFPRSTRESVIEFNDADRTRKHDVLAALRALGARARGPKIELEG